MALGVEIFERETFLSAINLGVKVLVRLGHPPAEAERLACAFEAHDNQLLSDSFAVREDETAYVGMVRSSMGLLTAAMNADRPPTPVDNLAAKRTE